MQAKSAKLYSYRWVVLAVFMLVNLAIQTLWISYAPVSSLASAYFGVDDSKIALLAMVFMIAFIPFSLPVSWAIDTWGFKKAVSIGAVMMGVFGLARGMAGQNYLAVLLATIGLAIAQPFFLNSWTKLPALWFSSKERATAVGLVTLANLVGTGLGLVLTPILVEKMDLGRIQWFYGLFAAITALLFLAFAKEKPATPPDDNEKGARSLMLDGLKYALSIKNFWLYLFVMFVGMGIFNGVTTWVEGIIRPRGFNPTDAGLVGALMLVGGVLGAVVIPALSDKRQKRVPYLMLGFALSIPGLLGLIFAGEKSLLFLSAAWLGFFLVGASPVGMQYAAEVTFPTPEGTSAGIIQLFGQGSVVFVSMLGALRDHSGAFTPGLLLAVGLLMVSLLLISRLKETT
ncbi:MAG: MFS transporter [Anaerolineaceae bacterium]|nr:MFS transporter [Anaerolineaceae bacterium]